MDWRKKGKKKWDIWVEKEKGKILIRNGGRRMKVDGEEKMEEKDSEYKSI